jgi:hypothetical protein
MAKIEGPLMSIEAHGTIGSRLTFSSRKTGQQVRFQNRQVDAQSSAQLEQRYLFDLWRKRWSELSSASQKEYNDRTISEQLNMTGYNLFIKENISTLHLTDDFSGDSLDTNKWTAFGESYGSISVSGGQCTITQTSGGGGNQNIIGIASLLIFPVGVSYKARVRKTSNRHAGIGFGMSPYYPYPHDGAAGVYGASIYLRIGRTEVTSYKDENNSAEALELTDYGTSWVTLEIKREDKNTIKFYINDTLVNTVTALFENKYPIYFSADGYVAPNDLIIDWAKVEPNQ